MLQCRVRPHPSEPAMGWTPGIRYYESRRAYYTKYQGRQPLLAAGPKDEPDGPTYQAAVQRFAQIMHAGETARAEDNCLVSAVISRFYFSLKRDERDKTLALCRCLLDPAIAEFGNFKVKDLKPFHVNDWLHKMSSPKRWKGKGRERPWGGTTKHSAIGKLSQAFYWAKKQGMITANPIAGMEKPE